VAIVYLDSSAIVKLVLAESESVVLRRHVLRYQTWISALAQVEVMRAVARPVTARPG
jgi:predicted nucleic acid-binding protein